MLKQMRTRVLSLFLCLCMVLSLMPVAALAEETGNDGELQVTQEPATTEETKAPDGTEETKAPDGTEETKAPDGTEETKAPDGTEETKAPDGTEETKAPDGTEETKAPDGTEETKTPDGTEETTEPEGNEEALSAVQAQMQALKDNYYREYDGELWVLFETLVVVTDAEELVAAYEETNAAVAAYDALSEEDQAVVDAEYGYVMDYMTQYAAAIEEKLGGVSLFSMRASKSIYDTTASGDYFKVIAENSYELIPGAVETEIVLNNADATDRKVAHIFTVDTKNPNVEIVPGYNKIDKYAEDPTNPENHTAAGVSKMAAYYEDTLGYDLVGGMNTSLAYDSSAPYSFLMYKGVVLQDKNLSYKTVENPEWKVADAFYNADGTVNDAALNQHTGACVTYLAIKQDGTCELRSGSEKFEADDYTVISANFNWCVKDGKNTASLDNRVEDAARSLVGIKADGTLVLCMVDGRGANNSTGLSNYELGEMMLALGCTQAFNCDGGGSSSFVSKRAGEDELTIRAVPCDGAERDTIHSIFIARSSSSVATGILKNVDIHTPVIDGTTAEYSNFLPGTTATFTALAKDTNGFEMEVPEGAEWALSDDSYGTITADGTVTFGSETGEVDVELWYDGNIVGYKTISVVNPVVAEFTQESTVLPYGKSVNLEMNVWADEAGEFPAYYEKSSFTWSFSNENAGTLDGLTFYGTSDESIKDVTITATYAHNDGADVNLPASTFTITFGKGSEVLINFEDGTKAGFMGFDEAKAWSKANGVNNTLVGEKPLAGQYSSEVDGNTAVVTAENGQVHNGNYALAWTLDNTEASFNSWTYNILFNTNESIVLRDVANGKNATTLGMWVYIPKGATGLSFQSQLFTYTATGAYSCVQDHFMFTTVSGVRKNLNSCTEADIPESRWVYASIDISKYDYLETCDPKNTTNSRSPSFIRTYVKPVSPAVHTFYIDDITLDYSSAVDDREAPVISGAAYVPNDSNVDFSTVATTATMNFTATIADVQASNMSGLDYSTAMIYVDGRPLDNVSASGSVMHTTDAVTLSAGTHKITFEIADKLGNTSELTKTLTVEIANEEALITLGGHNDSGEEPMTGSVYYVDLKTSDVSKVEEVYARIQLNTANTWEADYLTTLPGFTVEECYVTNSSDLDNATTYSIHDMENVLFVHLKKTADCDATGAQTLASIPVRVWYWDGVDHVTGEASDEVINNVKVTIDCDVMDGFVVTDAETEDGESFSGSISVATMHKNGVTTSHKHTAAPVEDKAATCTEDGYTGRTYCDECKSVVDWGTIEKATGHNHQVSGDKLVCSCGDELAGTGVVSVGEKKYYLLDGKLMTGWQSFGADGYCYADPSTKEVYAGCEFTVNGLTYTANEEGLMLGGAWDINFLGKRYSYGPGYYSRVFVTIDGDEYYFAEKTGYAYTGYHAITDNRNDPNAKVRWYHFDEDGKLTERLTMTGVLDTGDGLYYMEEGCTAYAGMVKVGDDYYCASDKMGTVLTGRQYVGTYLMSKSKNPLAAGYYEFSDDGKMLQGIVSKEDGTYYYELGKPVKVGWVLDGTDYYFFGEGGKAITGKQYVGTYDTQHSKNPYKNGTFVFADDGKLANSIVQLEDGWYYCVGGIGKQAGLINIDGCYYYADAAGKLATGRTYVGTYYGHGLVKPNYYEFGEDGKMLDGVVEKADGIYYYEQGVTVNTGWLKIGEDYYVFTDGGKALTGKQYVGTYLTQHSRNPFKHGTFVFGADGKLCDGVVGSYYYEAGVVKSAGLVYVDGNYYYADTDGKLATGRVYVGTYPSHGLVQPGYYEFGADGKMLQGVVEKDDGLYYYEQGKSAYKGLIERDGEYYYVNTDGKLEIGRVYVGTYASNGLVKPYYYEFGADGAMLNGFEMLEDGLYYYDMGQARYFGLKIIDSEMYYINDGGKVETGYIYVGTYPSNGLIPNGYYTFDEEGKLVK